MSFRRTWASNMNSELQINLFSQCNLMYSILGIDKPCIFLFRTTQFIISSDFPTRICCILFQIEFLSIVKLDMLFNENERKICILKIYTEIWAFLDEVWSQLKQNWYVFCFENCSEPCPFGLRKFRLIQHLESLHLIQHL